MIASDSKRKTEGVLSFGVSVLLLVSLSLVFGGRMRGPTPQNTLQINTASAAQLARSLGVDPEIGGRLVAYRLAAGGFQSSEEILDVPLFPRAEADRIESVMAAEHLDPLKISAPRLAGDLRVLPEAARRLVTWRGATSALQNGGRNTPPRLLPEHWIRSVPLLDARATRPLLRNLVMRTPDTVARQFWSATGLIGMIALLAPAILRRRLGGDPFLLPLSLLLTGLGVVLLFSIKDPLRDRAVYLHHLFGIAPALLAFTAMARLTPQARLRIRRWSYLWVFAGVALVLLLFLFGSGPEGVKLNLFHFQPVELIKLFLVLFLASYLGERAGLIADASRPWSSAEERDRKRSVVLPRRQDLGPIAVMCVVALTLFYVIRDLGPGLLVFAVFISALYLTTGRGVFVGVGLLLLLAGGFLGYRSHVGVFGTRVDMWLSPFQNSHPNGMQLAQACWGLASGGAEGSGLGLGMPGLIPRSGSDLAFVSWVEETGVMGAWLALLVYAVLVWRGLRIAIRAGSEFDRALAAGLTALFGLQTLLILCGVTGLIPLTGIALPFLSYGNSALVADFAVIGLLRGISVSCSSSVAPRPVVTAARRYACAYLLALLGGVGLCRLGRLQLLEADEVAVRPVVTPDADRIARAHQNPRLVSLAHEIERGSIYDRNGHILATSRERELRQLPGGSARAMADRRGRFYPYGAALAHLVGYVDPAVGGPYGFERAYNDALRGFSSYSELLTDYRQRNLPGYSPRRSRDLHLTIDAPLQRDIQALLLKMAAAIKDRRTGRSKDRAAIVLLTPQEGEVVVAASIPAFDPNTLTPEKMRRYRAGSDADEEHLFINRAISGLYPPGSTLKVATAACALDYLQDAERFRVACNRVSPEIHWQASGRRYARRNIRDDAGDPDFGVIALARAFEVSSNIYFAHLAVAVGSEVFRSCLTEKMGFRHTPSQSAFDTDLPDIGYGQGRMLASPLEMARMAAAVANGGVLYRPRFVMSISDPGGSRQTETPQSTTTLSRAMSAETAARMRELMRGVVTGGTARGVFDLLGFGVAGKTGTAQTEQGDQEPHSWFIGFAPYAAGNVSEPPRYAFACVVENGGYGKRVAAVICREALRKAIRR